MNEAIDLAVVFKKRFTERYDPTIAKRGKKIDLSNKKHPHHDEKRSKWINNYAETFKIDFRWKEERREELIKECFQISYENIN